MDVDKNYEKLREFIRHENELFNQRFAWLSAFQGLLFTALAFAWDKGNSKLLVIIFCLLGIIVAISIGIAMHRGNMAIDRLDKWWDQNKPENYSGLDIQGVRSRNDFLWFLMPGRIVPWALCIAWLCILFIKI